MIYLVSSQNRIYTSDIQQATINDCINYFKSHEEIEFDSETEGFDPHTKKLICIQLGDRYNQYVVDCKTTSILPLKTLLEEKLLLMQNAQFDLRFLYHQGIYPTRIFDTMLMECILTTGLGDEQDIKDIKEDCGKKSVALEYASRNVGLDDLGMKYLGVKISKDIRGVIHREGLTTRVIQYAAGDVDKLGLIKEKQLEEWEIFKNRYEASDSLIWLENEAVKVFARLLYTGINIDREKYYKEVVLHVNTTVESIKDTLNKIIKESNIRRILLISASTGKKKYMEIVFGGDLFNPNACNINWNSPEQKLGILRSIDPSIESSEYAEVNKRSSLHPLFKELVQYNKFKKLQDSFGENFLDMVNPKTGKVHSSIWQILSTGRVSMAEPNLAQIPSKGDLGKVIRSCFIPRSKDYVIVGGDYSGFELSIIAEFSQDPLWVNTLNNGGDLHSILCSETFDIDISKVKTPFYANPDITYRDVQKTLDFGLSYGMSKFKLSNTLQISVEEADQIIVKFFSKVPKVKQFLDTLGNLAKSRGYIKTAPPYSRVRRFPKWEYLKNNPNSRNKDKWLGEMERAGKNSPIQGVNADILKLSLINIQKEIETNNWDVFVLLTVYDEIQTEVNRSVAEDWRQVQTRIMIESAQTIIKTVPVKVDCKINECWHK